MAAFTKRKLSASTDGKGISVAAVASPGTPLHVAVAGQVAGTFDEVWLWAYNSHTASIALTIEMGGTSGPGDVIVQTIPFASGLFLVVPGLIMQNGGTCGAFASVASVVSIKGFVNNMTD